MKSEKIIFNVLLIFLAIHLIYSNYSLLLDISKMIDINQFTSIGLSDSEANLKAKPDLFTMISKLIFAISYSIITVTLIYLYPRIILIFLVALMDGIGIYLKYNIYQDYFIQLTAVYFGLYTALIVITSGLIRIYEKRLENLVINTNDISIDEKKEEKNIGENIIIEKQDLRQQLRKIQCQINATKNSDKLESLTNIKNKLLIDLNNGNYNTL